MKASHYYKREHKAYQLDTNDVQPHLRQNSKNSNRNNHSSAAITINHYALLFIAAMFRPSVSYTEHGMSLNSSTTGSSSNHLFPLVIATILKRHFRHPHKAIMINHQFDGQSSSLQQGDLLNEVIRLTDSKLMIRFYYPRTDYVRPRFFNCFMVDGYGSFRRIFATMDYSKYDFSGFYLVVIAGDVQEELSGLIRKIFDDLWSLEIYNVNLLVENDEGEVLVYTFFPYSKDHCGIMVSVLWYKFRTMTWTYENIDLYPDRLKSFHGCPLAAGTLEAKPYTILRRVEHSTEVSITGFEGDLMALLEEKLNFTVRYEFSLDAWGFARKMGESTGLMKMIQEGQVDVGLGCLALTQDRSMYLKPGIAFYTSLMTFAVPAGRPFTSFEKLFRPFRTEIWYFVVLYLLVGAVVTWILQLVPRKARDFAYGIQTTTPFMNMLNILFGAVVPRIPHRNFARTILILWIMFCFIIRTIYQGSLYLFLQRSMNHRPLQTMADIDNSGIQYHMMETVQRYFISTPHILEKLSTFIVPGKDALGRMIEKLGAGAIDGVVLVTIDFVAYHNKVFPQNQFVQIAREHVSVYPLGFYYPKKSRLTRVFDEQIRNIQSTGIIDFWIRRYGDYEFFKKPTGSAGPRKLTNLHLAGGYEVFGCWLLVSSVVFVLELLSVRIKSLRRLFLFIMD